MELTISEMRCGSQHSLSLGEHDLLVPASLTQLGAGTLVRLSGAQRLCVRSFPW